MRSPTLPQNSLFAAVKYLLALACGCATLSQLHAQPAALPDPKFRITDGPVNASLGGGSAGVSSLALVGTNLYVAGDFTTVDAAAIPRLTAVSPTTGASRSWVPTPNQAVTTLAASSDTLHVGGNFTTINLNGSGAITLNHYAAFSLADNSLVPIDASLLSASTVTALAATKDVIYAGDSFTTIGGDFRQNVASLSAIDATTYAWNPSPDVGPSVMALTDANVFLGGSFRFLGQSPTNQAFGFFAAYTRAPQLQIKKATLGKVQIDLTAGDRADAMLQGTTNLLNSVWTDLGTYAPGFPRTVIIPTTTPNQFFRVVAH